MDAKLSGKKSLALALAKSRSGKMKEYHLVWLDAHSDRTEKWLLDRLADGFDIHHLDGNHENNISTNLILVECQDHMLLHSGVSDVSLSRMSKRASALRHEKPKQSKLVTYRLAYEMFGKGLSWRQISAHFGWSEKARPGSKARIYAYKWSQMTGLNWPPMLKREPILDLPKIVVRPPLEPWMVAQYPWMQDDRVQFK